MRKITRTIRDDDGKPMGTLSFQTSDHGHRLLLMHWVEAAMAEAHRAFEHGLALQQEEL